MVYNQNLGEEGEGEIAALVPPPAPTMPDEDFFSLICRLQVHLFSFWILRGTLLSSNLTGKCGCKLRIKFGFREGVLMTREHFWALEKMVAKVPADRVIYEGATHCVWFAHESTM